MIKNNSALLHSPGYLVIVMFIACLAWGCRNDAPAENKESSGEEAIEDSRYAELYTYYSSEPSTAAEKDENAIIDYAIENSLDVERTPSGIYYLVHEQGDGDKIEYGQPLEVHYKGYFLDGKVFDSSYERERPIKFRVGNMIGGWNEALQLFTVGSRVTLLIPSQLAYGPRGYPGVVPPDTPLAFDIEILGSGQ